MDMGEFSARFFAFYKWESASAFPAIKYTRNTASEMLSCFEQIAHDRSIQASLRMLHPQARKFLSATGNGSASLYRLASLLTDELSRSVWRVNAPKWAVEKLKTLLLDDDGNDYFTIRIDDIHALLFPTGILAIIIDIRPWFKFEDSYAASVGKMILNALYRMEKGEHDNHTFLRRIFSDPRQQQSIVNRMGGNEQTAFIRGLFGQPVTLSALVDSLVDKDARSLMGNRFITKSFIKTGWNGDGDAFSEDELLDLIRLARSESDRYLPDRRDIRNSGAAVSYTFENVVFALSSEGVACWVKPKADQPFLEKQFRERYQTIYLQLFLLALHQRYALVDLATQLDSLAPWLREAEALMALDDVEIIAKLEGSVKKLHAVRVNVASFYLHAYFLQPATLTNHQQFYHDLQYVLGINDLLEEVQQETRELDYLIT